MRNALCVMMLCSFLLGWSAAGAESEVSRAGAYHEHALAAWQDGWAVARGNSVEIWSLRNLSAPRRTLSGYASDVTSLAATHDGRLLAVGEKSGGRISVWDLQTGREVTWTSPTSGEPVDQLIGHQFTVWALSFSPDGKILASGAYDRIIRLWDVDSGMEIGVLADHRGWIRSLSFSPDGRVLASSSCDGTVRLWDVASLREVHPPLRAGVNAYSVQFSPDGELLVAATNPGETKAYRAGQWTELWTYTPPRPTATYVVAVSPDSSVIATGGAHGALQLRDSRTGQLLEELEGHSEGVWGAVFVDNGDRLVSTDIAGEMRVWRLDQ